jgi:hypothetical protein
VKTPIGRVKKVSLLLVAVLLAAVVAGLVVPGRTGVDIEIYAWIAIAIVVFLEVGLRATPLLGQLFGDERRRR